MKLHFSHFILSIIICAIVSCHNTETIKCGAVINITSPSACYNANKGLPFKATATIDTTTTPIVWNFWINKDSLVGLSYKTLRVFQGSKTMTLADSLLKENQVVLVDATVNCSGKQYTSMYYAFFKTNTSPCARWVYHPLN